MRRHLATFDDIHTHRVAAGDNAVLCVDPCDAAGLPPGDELSFSVGIHPWNTARADVDSAVARLSQWLDDPRVVAVGEAGYDRNRGADADEQQRIFELQARMAAERGLPLVIHAVGYNDRLMRLDVAVPEKIVHGFRGKPELMRQLLAAGFAFSLPAGSPLRVLVPSERLYTESDRT